MLLLFWFISVVVVVLALVGKILFRDEEVDAEDEHGVVEIIFVDLGAMVVVVVVVEGFVVVLHEFIFLILFGDTFLEFKDIKLFSLNLK